MLDRFLEEGPFHAKGILFWPLMEMNFEILEVQNIHPDGQPTHILIVTYKHVSILYSTCLLFVTPPKLNTAPENGCLEAYVPLGEGNFSVATLNFVGVLFPL